MSAVLLYFCNFILFFFEKQNRAHFFVYTKNVTLDKMF